MTTNHNTEMDAAIAPSAPILGHLQERATAYNENVLGNMAAYDAAIIGNHEEEPVIAELAIGAAAH